MLDTYSIEASALREEDVRKIQRGFASRLCIPTDNKDESAIKHHLWDLTLIYNATGDKQAFFVREADAFEWNCVCMTCARVRELLALSSQPLTHNRIWSPKTTLQPFDESGDRRIFLAYAATNIWEQICTDPEPSKRPKAKELLMQIAPWVELDLITWRRIRNVTPVKISWLIGE